MNEEQKREAYKWIDRFMRERNKSPEVIRANQLMEDPGDYEFKCYRAGFEAGYEAGDADGRLSEMGASVKRQRYP